MTSDLAHDLTASVHKFTKAHPGPQNARALTLTYEVSPCILCRGDAVKLLLETDQRPDWMREECLWDADPETRRRVGG